MHINGDNLFLSLPPVQEGLKIQNEYGILTDETLNETCDTINSNAQYLSKTIDDFRDFIKGDSNKVEFNLTKNINHFLSLVNSSIKNHNLNVVLDLDDQIILESFPNELIQCLMNIYNNAKDALLEHSNNDSNRLILISTYKQDEHIIIKIKDNAGGIDSDIIEKIFEPYFTTKHQSRGTGLGLSMTYSLIVEGMNGMIDVHNSDFIHNNETYHGAEFKITLPLK